MGRNLVAPFDLQNFLEQFNISHEDFHLSGVTEENLKAIRADFLRHRAALEDHTDHLLRTLRRAAGVHSCSGRVKDTDHLLEKVVRKQTKDRSLKISVDNYRKVITDLVGLRLLHLFKDDWLEIHNFIRKKFVLLEPRDSKDEKDPGYKNPRAYVRKGDPKSLCDEYKNWGASVLEHDFGYRSVHYLIKTPLDFSIGEIVSEIQVRTVFEEAWGEIDHLIRYPYGVRAESTRSGLVLLNRLAGSADETASFVRDNYHQWERLAVEREEAMAPFGAADVGAFARLTGLSRDAVESQIWSPLIPEDQLKQKEEYEKRKLAEENVSRGLANKVLSAFYSPADSGLHRYSVLVDGARVETSIFTTPGRTGMNVPMNEVEVAWSAAPDDETEHPDGKSALTMLRYMREGGVKLWNAPVYRLREATFDGTLRLEFSMSDFFSSRFACGLLEDEIVDASLSCSTPTEIVNHLPLRKRYLGNGCLQAFGQRVCAGGVAAVCAFRRKDDFVILLEQRSGQVADSRGQITVVPKAYHQPGVGEWAEEVNPYCTTLREIYEEVFGGNDAERSRLDDRWDWYCDKNSKVKAIRDREFDAAISVTGFGIDTRQGNYVLSALVCVSNPAYWERFRDGMKTMWEHKNKSFLELSTRNNAGIGKLIVEQSWSSDALFAFLEALFELRDRFPELVDFPTLQREK